MKEDYLWDKTGEDAEIQGLENALKAFRFQEHAPPQLPQKVFTLEKPKARRFFQFGFALASFAAAVVVVLSLVWFQTSNNEIPAGDAVAGIKTPENVPQIKDESFNTNPAPVVKIENTKPSDKPKVVKAYQTVKPKIRPVKAILRTHTPKEPAETLTAEEKYAYDQLMLALSITGSKLKIVKDKINGIEEKNAALDAAQ